MTAQEFVDFLRTGAAESAAESVLESVDHPPGSPPFEEYVRANNWFKTLGTESKEQLRFLVSKAAEQAIFGVLCILDGVRVVSEEQVPPHDGEFVLEFRTKDSCVRLSTSWSNGGEPFLHDLL